MRVSAHVYARHLNVQSFKHPNACVQTYTVYRANEPEIALFLVLFVETKKDLVQLRLRDLVYVFLM